MRTLDVKVNDYSIRVIVNGDNLEKVIVFVPAMCRPASDFNDLSNKFVQFGYMTVGINTRGTHGSKGSLDNLSITDIVDDIFLVISKLGIKKIFIVGQAFGTRVARVFADRYPENTICSVSITMGGIEPPKFIYPSRALDMMNENRMDNDDFINIIRDSYFSKNNDCNIWCTGWDHNAIWYYCMVLAGTPQEELTKGGSAPMLILQGEDDRFSPPSAGEKMKLMYGNRVTVVTIKNAAHEIIHEQPEIAFKVLFDYFEKVECIELKNDECTSESEIKRSYRLGWDKAIIDFHKKRKISKFADFLIPKLQSNMTLLDCGCGIGNLSLEFADILDKGHVYGIDINDDLLEIANKSKKKKENDNITFMKSNVYKLDFPNETFDVVWCNTLFMHLKEPDIALKEINRVLKKGGIIAICDADWDSDIMYPHYQIIMGRLSINCKILKSHGSNMSGVHNLNLLTRYFSNVSGKAFVDYYSELEDKKDLANMAISIEHSIFSEGASEMSLEMRKKAWHSWANYPGSFFARTFCQAWGYKD